MSLSTNVTDLATRVATEAKALRTLINSNAADLSGLNTTNKINLINAINEANTVAKVVSLAVGDKNQLTTTTKTTIVAAINELEAQLGNFNFSTFLNDTIESPTTVWSSSKTNTSITAAVNAALTQVIAAAPAALNTLDELAAALGDDANFAATVTNALATKAADNAVVKLTGDQTVAGIKTFTYSPVVPDDSFSIAKVDLLQEALDAKATATGVGDTNVNYVTTFEAGLV